jgi:hypothetical protein
MDKRRHSELSAREADRDSSFALHFVARIDERRGFCRFVCETQPLLTITSHGAPERCPLCSQEDPIGSEGQKRGEANARQQG